MTFIEFFKKFFKGEDIMEKGLRRKMGIIENSIQIENYEVRRYKDGEAEPIASFSCLGEAKRFQKAYEDKATYIWNKKIGEVVDNSLTIRELIQILKDIDGDKEVRLKDSNLKIYEEDGIISFMGIEDIYN